MKALVWQGPEKMAVEEVPEPEALAGTVLVRPEAAGICGSEVEGYLGRMGNRIPPLVMGHEFAGRVVKVGGGVDGALVGRVVAVNPLLSDGTCRLCRLGLTNLCVGRRLIGVHQPGGFAELVQVPAGNVYPLPRDLPGAARLGALAEPLANGVHAVGLGTAGGHRVEAAVVIGAGTIGLMCLQAAAQRNFASLFAVEPHADRREAAALLGADEAFDSAEAAREAVLDTTEGLGADLVLDAVGATATRRAALGMLRPGGRAVFVGLSDDETALGFHGVVRGQLEIRGSYAYTAEDYETALGWLVEGRAGIGALPPVLPLEKGVSAFAGLARGPSRGVKTFLSAKSGEEGA